MQLPTQLPLSVRLRSDAQFDNFITGSNDLLRAALEQLCEGRSNENTVYIYGSAGTGRTHLLQACCHRIEQTGGLAIYLPASECLALDPGIFESLEMFDLVCIDDIDQLLGHSHWEEALFHLYNRLRDLNRRLLIAACDTPTRVGADLPDLSSRLQWGLVLPLYELDDQEKLRVLSNSAIARGLSVSTEVLQFILNHGSRNLSRLMHQLDELDQASLRAKRKLTIPFVKQVLGWN